ncbi:MAG: hypothetical protein IJS53_04565 [Clostridia bacterium]|nr:hypothetical protein [Clostridia bacterium]
MKKLLCILLCLLLLAPAAPAEEVSLPYRLLCGRVLVAFPTLPGVSYLADTQETNESHVWFVSAEEGGTSMVEAADVTPLLAQAQSVMAGESPSSVALSVMLYYAEGYFYPQRITDYTVASDGPEDAPIVTLRFTVETNGALCRGLAVLEGELLVLGLFPEDALGNAMLDAVQVLSAVKAEQMRETLSSSTRVEAGGAALSFPCAPVGREKEYDEGSILRSVTWDALLPTGEIFRFQQIDTNQSFHPLTKSIASSQMQELALSFLSPYRLRNLRGVTCDTPQKGVYRLRFAADMNYGDPFAAELCLILTAEGTAWLAWATAGEAGEAFVDSLELTR